ncbi:MAG: PEP-utilizing enzyme [Candidatus Paceibacterota bacterium]
MKNDFTLIFSDRVSFVAIEMLCESLIENKYPWGKINNAFIFIEGKRKLEAYYDKIDLLRMGPSWCSYFLKKKNVLSLFKAYDKIYKEGKKEARVIKAKNFDKTSNAQLIFYFKKFINTYKKVLTFYMAGNQGGEKDVEFLIKDKLSKHYKDKEIEDIFKLITEPTIPSRVFLEEKELLKLSKKKNISNRDFLNYVLEFPSCFINIYEEVEIFDFLREKIKNTDFKEVEREHKKIESRRKDIKKKQQAVFAKTKDDDIKFFAEFIQRMGVYRLEQKEIYAGLEFAYLSLLKNISQKINLGVEDMLNLYTSKEIIDFLNRGKKVNSEKIKKRKKIVACLVKSEKLQVLEGEKVFAFMEKNIKKPEDIKVLKGLSANKGIYSGEAYVMPDVTISELKHHFDKFKKGQILIADITQPNMMLLIKKASAIVTNQGGIACHSAIISREFNIPCVIGTKVATKVIKTGDKIEVNGNNGTVTILK